MKLWLSLLAVLIAVAVGSALFFRHPGATLKINNETSRMIIALHVSDQGSLIYGPNRLEDVLPPGKSVEIRVRHCDRNYDIRAEFLPKADPFETRISVNNCGQTTTVQLRPTP